MKRQVLMQEVWVGPESCRSNGLPGNANAAGPRKALLVASFPLVCDGSPSIVEL